jgi:hypothetical protein
MLGMKRIALQLLLSVALIFQGAYAFGFAPAQSACCCHDGQAAHAQCGHDGGTPCQPDCAQQCQGCAASAFIAVPAFTAVASDMSVGVSLRTRASAYLRNDLPPTRPPIV